MIDWLEGSARAGRGSPDGVGAGVRQARIGSADPRSASIQVDPAKGSGGEKAGQGAQPLDPGFAWVADDCFPVK